MTTPSGWYDWHGGMQTCERCGWRALGKEASMGDSFADGAEWHCPRCDHYFGFKAWPLRREVVEDPRAEPIDKELANRHLEGERDD